MSESPTEYIIVWRSGEVTIPETIVVPTPVEDFYAWTSTYLSHLTPLSSVLRVVDSAWRPSTATTVQPRTVRLVGLLFAEAAAARRGTFSAESMHVAECFGSLAFCLAQAGPTAASPPICDLAGRWSEARQLLGLPEPEFDVDHMLEVWKMSGCADATTVASTHQGEGLFTQRGPEIQFLLSALNRADDISLLGLGPQYALAVRELETGTQEDRIRRFKKLRRHVRDDMRLDDTAAGIVLGYALSRVSTDPFRHVHLMDPGEVRDVRPLFWYGWFEAVKAELSGAPWFGGIAGWRLLREITQYGMDRSDVDVDLEELRVLRRGTRGVLELATKRVGFVRVLLRPAVVVEFQYGSFVRTPTTPRPADPRSKAGKSKPGQQSLF